MNYREYVGDLYDLMGAHQLQVLVSQGLREHESLLDIGCGSLRAGRFFIMYLAPNCYVGIEPNDWLVKESIANEVGQDLVDLKSPQFYASSNFSLPAPAKFDFILAQSIFSHSPISQVELCLRNCLGYMHDKSKFLFTFVGGEEDYQGTEWVYPPPGAGIVTYKLETMQQLAKTCGYVFTLLLDIGHLRGQQWCLLQKEQPCE